MLGRTLTAVARVRARLGSAAPPREALIARQEGDYSSEQFMQWFIKEQIEEVASMNDLLKVVQRARENPLLAEEYLARESPGDEGAAPTAPPVAGGAL